MNLRQIVVALGFLLSTCPAFALDFTVVLKNADGSLAEDCAHVTLEGKCDRSAPLTLGRLSAAALSKANPGAPSPVTEQVLDGRLAQRIIDAPNANLSKEEIVKIKERIGKLGYNTVIVSQAIAILDPESVNVP